jgi:hypothetical protein
MEVGIGFSETAAASTSASAPNILSIGEKGKLT